MSKIIIAGKDAPVTTTISTIRQILQTIEIDVEEVKWFNPAPDCWSVHLQASNCPQLSTNGKGTSMESCLASGLGEFIERLATNFFFTDYFLENSDKQQTFCHYPNEIWFTPPQNSELLPHIQQGHQLLTEDLRQFYDPHQELSWAHLQDNNSDPENQGICTLPFQEVTTKTPVYFPVAILNNLYVSNGMAAGNSRDECTAQALAEIIERHVKKTIIQNGLALPDVPQSTLNQFPKICSTKSALENKGFSIRVKDASLGGQYPVICILLADITSGGAYASFGASLRFEIAIERTLTELLQGRNLEQLGNFNAPASKLELVAEETNLESHFINSDGLLHWRMFRDKPDFPYSPWDFSGSTKKEVQCLKSVISKQGFTMYQAEYLQYSMYSCRILVPGMSEIYPVDDLIYGNCNAGNILRAQLLKLPDAADHDLMEILDTLDSLGFTDQQLVSQLIGVVFPDKSAWHNLRLGELKALIYLALGEKEEATVWCDWCINFALLPQERVRLYRLLHTLLSLNSEIEKYKTSLPLFYSEDEIAKARNILQKKVRFPGLEAGRAWVEISADHKNLLQIYSQLNFFKTNFIK